MRTKAVVSSLIGAVGVMGSASADVNNMRDYFVGAGFGAQSASADWVVRYGGHDGALMAGAGTYFSGPYDHGTPIFGPVLEIGDYAGWWHGATFEGLFVHSGPGVSLHAQRNFAEATLLRGLTVQAEMVLNGNGGNGLGVEVYTIIGGVRAFRGGFAFNYATPETDHIVDFGSDVAMAAGDRVEVVYLDAGSYLYDHANTNVLLNVVPAPGALALAGLAALGGRRRR